MNEYEAWAAERAANTTAALRLRGEGLTMRQIGERLGISASQVGRLLKEAAGVPRAQRRYYGAPPPPPPPAPETVCSKCVWGTPNPAAVYGWECRGHLAMKCKPGSRNACYIKKEIS